VDGECRGERDRWVDAAPDEGEGGGSARDADASRCRHESGARLHRDHHDERGGERRAHARDGEEHGHGSGVKDDARSEPAAEAACRGDERSIDARAAAADRRGARQQRSGPDRDRRAPEGDGAERAEDDERCCDERAPCRADPEERACGRRCAAPEGARERGDAEGAPEAGR
jgi:hypothetical protein